MAADEIMMSAAKPLYRFGEFSLDPSNLRLTAKGVNCPLEPKSFRLLQFLIENRDRAVSKDEILSGVWDDVAVTDNALTRAIGQIRKALDDNPKEPKFIETVPTVGYRFIGQLIEDHGPPVPAGRNRSSILIWTVSAIALFALVAAGFWFATQSAPAPPSVAGVRQITNSAATDVFPSFSPDGSQIAFSSNRSGRYEIYVRSLAAGGAERQITSDGQENIQPAWSPDGQYLAYVSRLQGGVKIIPTSGGPARIVSDTGDSPQWSADGRELVIRAFSTVNPVYETVNPDSHTVLALVNVASGSMRALTETYDHPINISSPHWLADGRHIIVASRPPLSRQTVKSTLWIADSERREARALSVGTLPLFPVVSAQGQLYFADEAASVPGIWSGRTGPNGKVSNVQPLLPVQGAEARDLAISADAKHIAFSRQTGQSAIWMVFVDSQGIATRDPKLLIENRNIRNTVAQFSRDASKIVWSSTSGENRDTIFVAEPDGSSPVALTPADQNSIRPQWIGKDLTLGYVVRRGAETSYWIHPLQGKPERVHPAFDLEHSDRWRPSPDGAMLAAQISEGGTLRVGVAGLRGGPVHILTPRDRNIGFPCWSPDGRWLAAEELSAVGVALVVLPSADGEIRTLRTGFEQNFPWDWSPNGDRILTAGLRGGVWNIFWISVSTGRVQLLTHFTTQSGFVRYPSWSPRGGQILFERNDLTSNIYVADLKTPSR